MSDFDKALDKAVENIDKPATVRMIREAIALAIRYGQIDGAHHKTWVIDQMIRTLAGEHYDEVIKASCDGEDGPNTYDWDVGIAP